MDKALEMIGYDDLPQGASGARAQGKLYGIGVASFTEVVGAGPAKDYDIIGIKMNDGAELRVLHRQGDPEAELPDAGAGPRDDVRADRRR